ncbi:Udp-Glucuronosyltransferase 1-6 [Manis pentadactyla]|nr:Udp-Glucuronosyltransferase 1-6 [Manis pentadactyla]
MSYILGHFMQALHELTVGPLTYSTALEFRVNIIARRGPTIVPEQHRCLDNFSDEMNRMQQNGNSQTNKGEGYIPMDYGTFSEYLEAINYSTLDMSEGAKTETQSNDATSAVT